jgi:hypothetical protein
VGNSNHTSAITDSNMIMTTKMIGETAVGTLFIGPTKRPKPAVAGRTNWLGRK